MVLGLRSAVLLVFLQVLSCGWCATYDTAGHYKNPSKWIRVAGCYNNETQRHDGTLHITLTSAFARVLLFSQEDDDECSMSYRQYSCGVRLTISRTSWTERAAVVVGSLAALRVLHVTLVDMLVLYSNAVLFAAQQGAVLHPVAVVVEAFRVATSVGAGHRLLIINGSGAVASAAVVNITTVNCTFTSPLASPNSSGAAVHVSGYVRQLNIHLHNTTFISRSVSSSSNAAPMPWLRAASVPSVVLHVSGWLHVTGSTLLFVAAPPASLGAAPLFVNALVTAGNVSTINCNSLLLVHAVDVSRWLPSLLDAPSITTVTFVDSNVTAIGARSSLVANFGSRFVFRAVRSNFTSISGSDAFLLTATFGVVSLNASTFRALSTSNPEDNDPTLLVVSAPRSIALLSFCSFSVVVMSSSVFVGAAPYLFTSVLQCADLFVLRPTGTLLLHNATFRGVATVVLRSLVNGTFSIVFLVSCFGAVSTVCSAPRDCQSVADSPDLVGVSRVTIVNESTSLGDTCRQWTFMNSAPPETVFRIPCNTSYTVSAAGVYSYECSPGSDGADILVDGCIPTSNVVRVSQTLHISLHSSFASLEFNATMAACGLVVSVAPPPSSLQHSISVGTNSSDAAIRIRGDVVLLDVTVDRITALHVRGHGQLLEVRQRPYYPLRFAISRSSVLSHHHGAPLVALGDAPFSSWMLTTAYIVIVNSTLLVNGVLISGMPAVFGVTVQLQQCGGGITVRGLVASDTHIGDVNVTATDCSITCNGTAWMTALSVGDIVITALRSSLHWVINDGTADITTFAATSSSTVGTNITGIISTSTMVVGSMLLQFTHTSVAVEQTPVVAQPSDGALQVVLLAAEGPVRAHVRMVLSQVTLLGVASLLYLPNQPESRKPQFFLDGCTVTRNSCTGAQCELVAVNRAAEFLLLGSGATEAQLASSFFLQLLSSHGCGVDSVVNLTCTEEDGHISIQYSGTFRIVCDRPQLAIRITDCIASDGDRSIAIVFSKKAINITIAATEEDTNAMTILMRLSVCSVRVHQEVPFHSITVAADLAALYVDGDVNTCCRGASVVLVAALFTVGSISITLANATNVAPANTTLVASTCISTIPPLALAHMLPPVVLLGVGCLVENISISVSCMSGLLRDSLLVLQSSRGAASSSSVSRLSLLFIGVVASASAALFHADDFAAHISVVDVTISSSTLRLLSPEALVAPLPSSTATSVVIANHSTIELQSRTVLVSVPSSCSCRGCSDEYCSGAFADGGGDLAAVCRVSFVVADSAVVLNESCSLLELLGDLNASHSVSLEIVASTVNLVGHSQLISIFQEEEEDSSGDSVMNDLRLLVEGTHISASPSAILIGGDAVQLLRATIVVLTSEVTIGTSLNSSQWATPSSLVALSACEQCRFVFDRLLLFAPNSSSYSVVNISDVKSTTIELRSLSVGGGVGLPAAPLFFRNISGASRLLLYNVTAIAALNFTIVGAPVAASGSATLQGAFAVVFEGCNNVVCLYPTLNCMQMPVSTVFPLPLGRHDVKFAGGRCAVPTLTTTTTATTTLGATTSASHTSSKETPTTSPHHTHSVRGALSATDTVMLLPPSAPVQPPAVVQAAVVAVVAPAAGVILAAPIAGLVQRSALSARYAGCSAVQVQSGAAESMSIAESPTQLVLGAAPGAVYRGAVVGNAVLLLFSALLAVAFGLAKRAQEVTFRAALASARLPGRLYVVYAILLQPTVTASVGLLAVGAASDAVIGVIGLALMLAVAVGCVRYVWVGCRDLVRAVQVAPAPGLLNWIAAPRVLWTPTHSTGSCQEAVLFPLHAETLIGKYRQGYQLFFASGVLSSIITGGVGVLNPDDGPAVCSAALYALLGISLLSLVSLVLLRPFGSPGDFAVHVLLESLSSLSCAMSLLGVPAANGPITYAQLGAALLFAALRVAIAAASLLGVVTIISSPKGVEGTERVAVHRFGGELHDLLWLRADDTVDATHTRNPSPHPRVHDSMCTDLSLQLDDFYCERLCQAMLAVPPPTTNQQQEARLRVIVTAVTTAVSSLSRPSGENHFFVS